MGSEQNDGTSYQPSQPTLCANNCGFFGNPSTMNLCSKCYREVRNREEQAFSAKSAMEKSLNPKPQIEALPDVLIVSPSASDSSSSSPVALPVVSGEAELKMANRCRSCNKKVGLTGFKCKCGLTFCGSHRYPENHECTFDFKEAGRSAIAKANPIVKADKLEKF